MRTLKEIQDSTHNSSTPTRLIYTTDWHATNRPPSKRTDNYHQALLDKLGYIMDVAESIGAHKTILGGGDIFDKPLISFSIADDIADLLIRRGFCLATLFGNHDLPSSLHAAPATLLGHLIRRHPDTFRFLPPLGAAKHPLYLGPFAIWGYHYRYNNHVNNPKHPEVKGLDLFVPVGERTNIIVAHSMILEKPMGFEGHTLFSDVTTNADMILLGHYHPAQGPVRLNNDKGTLIGGPGALMRGTLSGDDINRTPSMAIIDLEGPTLHLDYIPIKVAKPSSEIFNLVVAEREAKKIASLEAFREDLSDLTVQSPSVAGVIESIATADKVPAEVKQEALRRIGAV